LSKSDITKILALALYAVVGTTFTYFLWNWPVPDIFHLRPIRFVEAWGLWALARGFFGNAS
jgi:hypothetical protein